MKTREFDVEGLLVNMAYTAAFASERLPPRTGKPISNWKFFKNKKIMREIKFRGKRIANGKWVYGSLLLWPDGCCTILESKDGCNYVWKRNIDPDTVGQYTGLKDRNGKDVWEGDLLRTLEGDIMIVEWEDAKIITRCVRPHNPRYKNSLTFAYPVSVVIGNIHDNPELLEGKE